MMNKEDKRQIKLRFPLGLYLKQLFSNDTYVRYINPFSFWHSYRMNHLETCHELNTVQYLKRCHRLDCPPTKPKLTKISLERHYTDTQANSRLEPAKLNIIYSQPQIELKYRGVTYYTKGILSVNISFLEINSSLIESSSFKQSNNFNNISAPEKSGSN